MRFTTVQVMCLHVRTDLNNAAAFRFSVEVVPLHAIKAYRGVELSLHSFLTSALAVSFMLWPLYPSEVLPRGTHGVGSWVGCRALEERLQCRESNYDSQ